MKCEELKAIESATAVIEKVYLVNKNSDVDAAIDELKVIISQKEDAIRKAVDLGYKIKKEREATKRALWLARAMRAHDRSKKILRDAGIMFAVGKCHEWDILNSLQKKWQRVEDKCLAKVEEYK